jgi:Fur family ferric uptake transcriptional regulator
METQLAREILTQCLRTRQNSRATTARFAVLDAVLETQGHFDADNLYYRLTSKGVRISRATVYNTLQLLMECGLVAKYRFAGDSSRYEKAFGKPHHHHLVCLECGEIIEFVDQKLERIQEEVCAAKQFKPQSFTMQVFGSCAKCRK